MLAILSVLGCSKAGLQGTTIASKFGGITTITPVSPTSIKLGWSLQARFNEYRVYKKGFTTPTKKETFAYSTIGGLTASTYYEFSVTGVDSLTQEEEGYGNFVGASTLSNFGGLKSNGVTTKDNGSVNLSWIKNGDNVTYKVFAKKESETWNLNNPLATVIGDSTATLSSLTTGNKYCFWVIAEYEDGTYEPSNLTESYINSKAPCALVQSLLANLPTVKVNKTFVGNFPWFWTEGGDSTYKTEIFQRSTDIRMGVITGTGYFRSIVPATVGSNDLYAKVTAPSGGVSLVDITAEGTNTTASTKPLFKALTGTNASTPLTPKLAGNGNGIQELGMHSVTGDFNCDGLKDIAISAPATTPFVTGSRAQTLGSVVVYYSYLPGIEVNEKPRLKTDVAPSTDAIFPNPQLIYYTNLNSGHRFGKDIQVGNINGDCYSRYTTTASDAKANRAGVCTDLYEVNTIFAAPISTKLDKIKRTHTCDDLVVLSNNGGFYVIYGDPVKGLVTGSGGSSLGLNEYTCDQSSYKCRPVRHTMSDLSSLISMAVGDYNNDGFDDIAIAGSGTTHRAVKVFRGTLAGAVPDSAPAADKHNVIDLHNYGDNGYDGNTDGNIDMTVNYASFAGGGLNYGTNIAAITTDNWGAAMGTAFNSRFCMKNATYTGFNSLSENISSKRQIGYDFTKCDDLVIGAPNRGTNGRGSIFICRAEFTSSATNKGRIIDAWTCTESFPDATSSNSKITNISIKGYGSSILGVRNQNGYPLVNILTPPNNYPNLTGAVFVGAPDSTINAQASAGAVFGYYMTPQFALQNTTIPSAGFTELLSNAQAGASEETTEGHNILAVNSVPCDSQNNNGYGGLNCKHQVLFTSPAEANVYYGTSLSFIEDTESVDRALPALAISAPNRSVTSSDGKRTITSSGVVYLYKADVSSLGYEGSTRIDTPQMTNDTTDNCTSNCTWYSGGINPAGPTFFYVKDLSSGAKFGLGRATGGDFNGDGAGDFAAGSPYLSTTAYNAGSDFIFYSKGSFAASESNPSLTLKPNISKELNYQFETGQVIGDINGDGYDDIATQVTLPGKSEFIIYYGSSNGLKTSPLPSRIPVNDLDPKLVVVDNDSSFGKEFYRIGSINGDPYDDVLVLGSRGSYIYYGSSSGIVSANQPSISPVGQNPLRFANSGTNVVTFHDSDTMGYATQSGAYYNLQTGNYNFKNRAVTFGDYNGDGFGDFAIATRSSAVPSISNSNGIVYSGNQGRVWVVYGSSSGAQVNRSTGTISLTSGNDIEGGTPCVVSGTNKVCKVQVLASPTVDASGFFGWSLTTLPSLEKASGEDFDELVVSNPYGDTNLGFVYLFRGANLGLANTAGQTIRAYPTSASGILFGYNVSYIGDVNGDNLPDIAATGLAPSGWATNETHIHIIYTGTVSGATYGFLGPSGLGSLDLYQTTTRLGTNRTYNLTVKPQQLTAPSGFENSLLGVMTAPAGDLNGDGIGDMIAVAPYKNYDLDINVTQAGAFVIYYGSTKGLLIGETANATDPDTTAGTAYTPTPTPKCYGGSVPMCEPAVIYLPDSQDYENTYLSISPKGDFNGDGISDIILGSPGRNHPSGQAFSTGVIYVL